jgi:lysophospholipase L1-like esterase
VTAPAGQAAAWLPWQRRPLSVVVLGNSIPLMQMPPRADHADGTYPEVLADLLSRDGIPVQLANECRWFELAHTGARRTLRVLARHQPDVLVIHYGVNEMMPWLLPIGAVRHLMRRNVSLARSTRLYRRHVADPVWEAVKAYRMWASDKAGLNTWQLSPHRFRASLELMVRQARQTTAPLTLVMDINPPGEIMRRYLPGVERRQPVFQQLLSDVVDTAAHPDVRLVRASAITEAIGLDAAMPDSLHWTPEAHARVAALLADEVRGWVSRDQR